MTRAELRNAMPESTKFIDDIRQAFGQENIVAIRASENGQTVEWSTKRVPYEMKEGV